MMKRLNSLGSKYRYPLLAALVFTLLASYHIAKSILASTNSTAAIGFIFLPFFAGFIGLYAGFVCFAIQHGYTGLRSANNRNWLHYLTMSVGLFALVIAVYYVGNGLWLETKIAKVEKMNASELHQELLDNAEDPNRFIIAAIASHAETSSEDLDFIAHFKYLKFHHAQGSLFNVQGTNTKGLAVQRLVALNPKVKEETLRYLKSSPVDYVQSSVASSLNASPGLLKEIYDEQKALGEKASNNVYTSLAGNPNSDPDMLHELLTNKYEYARKYAEDNLKRRNLLKEAP